VKKIIIKKCDECPNFNNTLWGSKSASGGYYYKSEAICNAVRSTDITKATIVNEHLIPDWCPLEDSELRDKEEMMPTTVAFYYMNSNHTFVSLHGNTLEEILKNADIAYGGDAYGMLCPAILLANDREIRRIGKGVHGSKDTKIWNEGKKRWLSEMESDPDIRRIIQEGAE
jgi:hypothetical protein